MMKTLGVVSAIAGLGYWLGTEQAVSRGDVPQEGVAAPRLGAAHLKMGASPPVGEIPRQTAAREKSAPPKLAEVGVPGRIPERSPKESVRTAPSLGSQYTNHGFAAGHRPLVLPSHPAVERYIRAFTATGKGRATVATWLQRLPRYRPMVLDALRKYGMPEELLAVALIESGLDPNAVSPAGATGMWQFIRETAVVYGLRVTEQMDERRVPELSTDAAIRHLRDLHARFNSWPLAIAAYNAGEARINQVAVEAGSFDFWRMRAPGSSLPTETASYVPKVLAMMRVLQKPSAFGFHVPELEEPDAYVRVEVPVGTRLTRMARALGVPVGELRTLNPALVGDAVYAFDGQATLTVPAGYQRIAELVAPDAAEPTGDGLLARLIAVADTRRLRPLLRQDRGRSGGEDAGEDWERLFSVLKGQPIRTYRVKSGDSLHKVAKLLGVNEEQLRRENDVRDPRAIQIGQLLRVPSAGTPL